VFRSTSDGIIEIPKNTTTWLNFDKLPKYDFFAVKDGNLWAVIELRSGLS
jgi:hypothetical protein